MTKNVTSTVDDDLVSLDQTFEYTTAKRKELVDKLGDKIAEITLNTDDPKALNAKISMINAYSGVLADIDRNASGRVNAKLRKKEGDDAKDVSAVVAGVLLAVKRGDNRPIINSDGSFIPDDPSLIDTLNKKFAECDLEDIKDSELRMDPNDMS